MKLLTALKLTIAVMIAAVAWLAFGTSGHDKVAAHEVPASEAAKAATYSYVAQSGDSYTKIARKAVQTYGLKNKINLTPAGIVFAETNLTRAAGSPELNLGQEVKVNESDVHEWVDKAQDLSDAKEAAWNYYVQFVDFNTNNVGESS